MALQPGAIDSRLEALKHDERRVMFDSKLREFREENEESRLAIDRSLSTSKKVDASEQMNQVVRLLEELSRRIEGLERKDRTIAEELRRRAHKDRRRWSILWASGVALTVTLFANRLLRLF